MSETLKQTEPIILETEQAGLLLVQMTTVDDDAEYFQFQNNNLAHIAKFGNTIDESVEAVTERRIEKDRKRFSICKDGTLVGMEGYTPSENGQEAEVGILLAKGATGHGYATSALKALSTHIYPQFNRVFAEVEPNNAASINLIERSGYVRVAGEVERDWGRAVVFEFKK